MSEIKCDCLCIRAIDYKENDKLITLYAFGRGKITAVIKGVKKPKAKLRYASSLLCFGAYILNEKNGYHTVITCDLIDSFYNIWTDIDKYYPALCALEILDGFSYDNAENDEIATLTIEFLKNLCYGNFNTKMLYLSYLSEAISMMGYEMNFDMSTDYDKVNGKSLFFDFSRGGLVYDSRRNHNAIEISDEISELFLKIKNKEKDYHIDNKNFIIIHNIFYQYMIYITETKFRSIEQYIAFLIG